MGVVYKIRNKVNGKVYVGQTAYTVEKAVRRHSHPKNDSIVARAIRKYGLQSFVISIIDVADSRNILCEKEVYWIKKLQCKSPSGYNATDGGEGVVGSIVGRVAWNKGLKGVQVAWNKGKSFSSEVRKKMSLAALGRDISKETRKKISVANTGKKRTVAQRKRIAKAATGRKFKPEVIVRFKEINSGSGNPMFGIVPWNKGRKLPKSWRRRWIAAQKGIHLVRKVS